MAPRDIDDEEDGFHPFKGLASFSYSIVDRSSRSERSLSITESNAACKSHTSIGGSEISSSSRSRQDDDNSSRRDSSHRGQSRRHARPPTRIMTTTARRENTSMSNNRRIMSPSAVGPGKPTFNKYLKYNNRGHAKEAGKYRRRCDASSKIDDVSSVSSSCSERNLGRNTLKQKQRKESQVRHCIPKRLQQKFQPCRGVQRNISSHKASSSSPSSSMLRRRQSSIAVNPRRSSNIKRSCNRSLGSNRSCSDEESRIVSFKEKVQVRCVSYTADLLPNRDPIRKLWYSQSDYDMIYKRSCDLVDLYLDASSTKNRNHPRNASSSLLAPNDEFPSILRGLEGLIDKIEKDKEDTKSKAWDSVLDEQFLQRDNKNTKFLDDKEISNVYKLCTFKSQRDAIKRAKNDESEIQKYLEDTRREYLSMMLPATCTSSSPSIFNISTLAEF